MPTFVIDQENNILACTSEQQVQEARGTTTVEVFSSEKELTKLSASWPASRPLDVWNSFAGVAPFDDLKPVKKFTDRKTAVTRIWRAIQRLAATVAPQDADVAPKARRSRKAATAEPKAATTREGSKKAIVLDLLKRPEGATLNEIREATGWEAHSVRGFISGSLGKKMGLTVESSKRADGERVYKVV